MGETHKQISMSKKNGTETQKPKKKEKRYKGKVERTQTKKIKAQKEKVKAALLARWERIFSTGQRERE